MFDIRISRSIFNFNRCTLNFLYLFCFCQVVFLKFSVSVKSAFRTDVVTVLSIFSFWKGTNLQLCNLCWSRFTWSDLFKIIFIIKFFYFIASWSQCQCVFLQKSMCFSKYATMSFFEALVVLLFIISQTSGNICFTLETSIREQLF